MIWILLIAAVIGTIYFFSKLNNNNRSASSNSNANSSANEQIPIRLKGIHPSANSFWDTEEFYSRLGEECSKITDNKFVLYLNVKPNGDFTACCTFIDSAKVFFPALSNDLTDDFSGNDEKISNFGYTAKRFSEIIQEDAPSAHISFRDDLSGKSFNIVWNPDGLP